MKNVVKSFLIGIVILSLLAIICASTLGNSAATALSEKYDFESTYTNTKIDFVIPSPTDDQIYTLETDRSFGIGAIAPYYTAESNLNIGNTTVKSNVMIFSREDRMNITPYNAARIIDGSGEIKAGEAIVDFTYAQNNNVVIGDKISMTLLGRQHEFIVVAVSEDNQSYPNGSVAVVMTSSGNNVLLTQNVKYSGAFVAASDYSIAEAYLMNEYKPMGRMKDRQSFDSEDAYNQHISNFNAADWSKEITIYKDNFSALSVKYANTENSAKTSMYLITGIGAASVIAYGCFALASTKNKKALTIIVRKTKDCRRIKKYYYVGVVLLALAFTAFYGGTMFLSVTPARGLFHSVFNGLLWMPSLGTIIGLVITLIIISVGIKRMYGPINSSARE